MARVSPARAAATISGADLPTPVALIVGGKTRAREKRFDAPSLPAVTEVAGKFVGTGPGQRVVAPFARDGVGTDQRGPVDDGPSTDPGAEYHSEHGSKSGPGSVARLGKREAIGVVAENHRSIERRRQGRYGAAGRSKPVNWSS